MDRAAMQRRRPPPEKSSWREERRPVLCKVDVEDDVEDDDVAMVNTCDDPKWRVIHSWRKTFTPLQSLASTHNAAENDDRVEDVATGAVTRRHVRSLF